MDVLLVNAAVKSRSAHARLSPPLGLAYIGAALRARGYDVAAEDCNVSAFNAARLGARLATERPRLVGISATTESSPNALAIASLVREVSPETLVVIGGPHASVLHRELAARREIDIVARGEGERTLTEIVDRLAAGLSRFDPVDGITYRDGGVVVSTPDRAPIDDPDTLPWPARDLFPVPLYEGPTPVLMSRGGCPCRCAFCAVNNIWNGRRRFRRAVSVVSEIVALLDAGTSEIAFADDTFTLSRRHVIALCDELLEAGSGRAPCAWRCTTRVDLVDRALLERMAAAGCVAIGFGVESGSTRILQSLAKPVTRDRTRHAVGIARDLGIEVLCSFMFPHPDDTEDTIAEQAAFMREIAAAGAGVSLAFTTPFPGTTYAEEADALGIRILTDRYEEYDAKHLVIATRHLSEERLQALAARLIDEVGLAPAET